MFFKPEEVAFLWMRARAQGRGALAAARRGETYNYVVNWQLTSSSLCVDLRLTETRATLRFLNNAKHDCDAAALEFFKGKPTVYTEDGPVREYAYDEANAVPGA